MNDLSADCCLSGGAIGADLLWGDCASFLGHSVIHWSFARHRTSAPKDQVVELSEDDLSKSEKHLHRANMKLKRRVPRDTFVLNLLRRNWYQVLPAERVYAIASIGDDGNVAGGTGWAVALFVHVLNKGRPCECYVFDQDAEAWFVWKGDWEKIDLPPKPFGVWAGIGTRKIKPVGEEAIRALMTT